MKNHHNPFAAAKEIMGDNILSPGLVVRSLGYTDAHQQCPWWLRGLEETLPHVDELERIKDTHVMLPLPPDKDDISICVGPDGKNGALVVTKMEFIYRTYVPDTGWIALYCGADGTCEDGVSLKFLDLLMVLGVYKAVFGAVGFLFEQEHKTCSVVLDQTVVARWLPKRKALGVRTVPRRTGPALVRGIHYVI